VDGCVCVHASVGASFKVYSSIHNIWVTFLVKATVQVVVILTCYIWEKT